MLMLSVYINPWGNYGKKGYFNLYNTRLTKTDYIESLSNEELPQVVVLGSSNVMRFRPATIKQYLGKSAFCYGVFWGKSEDMLCITKHLVKDLNHAPELLIIGIDTWTFKPAQDEHPIFPGVRRRLLNTPVLVEHHPDVKRIPLYWSKFIDAFSNQQIIAAIKAFRRSKGSRSPYLTLNESSLFDLDGTRVSYGDVYGSDGQIFEAVESSEYPITERLAEIVEAGRYRELHHFNTYNFDSFYPPRVKYMELLLELCDQEGIQVVFVKNPVHPIFWDVLMEHTPQSRNLVKLEELLERFEKEYKVVLGTVDASQIENFGGDPEGFFDEIHPSSKNCDLILQQVAKLVTKP